MLSKLIISSYGTLLEISIWVILVGSFIGGWVSQGFLGALVSLLGAFVFSVVFFGAFLILVDIRKSVRSIEEGQKPQA